MSSIYVLIAGTALSALYFILIMRQAFAYSYAKRALKKQVLQTVALLEEEINHLNELMQQEQLLLKELNDEYILHMTTIIWMAEQNDFNGLDENTDWQDKVNELYKLLRVKLTEAKLSIKNNALRQAKLKMKIHIIKTQTPLIKP